MPAPRSLASLLAAAAAASACRAQESVSHTWAFIEVTAGTNTPVSAPNGLIEPGESARISLTVTVSPAVGSTVTYVPPPPPGTGTVAGLASVFFDLLTTGASNGTWSFITRAPGWALGDPGTPQPNGQVLNILAAQFIPLGQTASSQNPIPGIWRGVWSPSSYTPRNVLFLSRPALPGSGNSSILIQYGIDPQTGAPLYVGKYVASLHSQVTIPIVPAPGSAPGLLLIIAARRSRRRPQSRTYTLLDRS